MTDQPAVTPTDTSEPRTPEPSPVGGTLLEDGEPRTLDTLRRAIEQERSLVPSEPDDFDAGADAAYAYVLSEWPDEAAASRPAALDVQHEHEILGEMPPDHLHEGRALLVGRLVQPIPSAPLETHCLHVTTPMKGEVVFGVTEWDLAFVAAMAEVVNGGPLNRQWVSNRARSFAEYARLASEAKP